MSLDSILRSTGKNLFDINTTPTFTRTGATYSISGTTITFKSNNTTNNSFYYSIPVEIGKTYTVSVDSIDWDSTSLEIFLSSTNAPDRNNYGIIKKTTLSKTFTATSNTLWIHGYLSYTAGDFTFSFDKLQVEEGSAATSYEPYQQGPKSIKIGDKEVLKLSYGSRNLFDETKITNTSTIGLTMSTNSDGTHKLTGTLTADFSYFNKVDLSLPQGTTITATGWYDSTPTGNFIGLVGYTEDNKLLFQLNSKASGVSLTNTLTANLASVGLIVRCPASAIGDTVTFNNIRLQLEIGNKATEYVPYSREVVWESN